MVYVIESVCNDVLEVTGLLALVLTPVTWFVRRPQLEIRAKVWRRADPLPFQFAASKSGTVLRPRRTLVTRQEILRATVTLEFRKNGQLGLAPVLLLDDGEAYAWGAESDDNSWRNADWTRRPRAVRDAARGRQEAVHGASRARGFSGPATPGFAAAYCTYCGT
jgi:hypothetical protein